MKTWNKIYEVNGTNNQGSHSQTILASDYKDAVKGGREWCKESGIKFQNVRFVSVK
jgi:hypothetical protein